MNQVITPDIWGPHGWKFLHYISFGYPENPTINIKNQYAANPEKIVAKIFLLINPTKTAIKAARIFGLFSRWNNPELSKKTDGNMMAGKIAEGT